MTFTYTPDFTTDRDNIRLHIGDTQSGKGPRPDKRNFSDEEIAAILSDEDGRRNGAIAGLFEILTAEWRAYALSEKKDDVDFDAKGVADGYAKEAERWRKKPGGSPEAAASLAVVNLTRVDAWTSGGAEYS